MSSMSAYKEASLNRALDKSPNQPKMAKKFIGRLPKVVKHYRTNTIGQSQYRSNGLLVSKDSKKINYPGKMQ